MKVSINRRFLRAALHWTQRGFLYAAIPTFGYIAFEAGDAWLFQRRETQRLEAALHDKPSAVATPIESAKPPAIGPDGLIGRIQIPSIGVSVVVVEGVDKPTLRRAVGHIPGTALPGQIGNMGIAAHRDSYFRPLRKIRRDDTVTLTTLGGDYRYRVVSTKIVKPESVEVLDPDGTEILTLITCYPFYFVGSAPSRFIVRAERLH